MSLGEGRSYLFLPTSNDSGVGPAIFHAYLPFFNTNVDATIGCVTDGTTTNAVEYGLFISGSCLIGFSLLYPLEPPVSPFLFTRLTSFTPTNSSLLYLYHQINDKTLAEDTHDASIGHWTSANITVSTA